MLDRNAPVSDLYCMDPRDRGQNRKTCERLKNHFPMSKMAHCTKFTLDGIWSDMISTRETPNPPLLDTPLSVIFNVEDLHHYSKASSNPPYPPSVILPGGRHLTLDGNVDGIDLLWFCNVFRRDTVLWIVQLKIKGISEISDQQVFKIKTQKYY